MATNIQYDFDPTPQFVHKELTKVEGRPNHMKLKEVYKQTKSNLRKVHSPAGCGTKGHLRLFYPLATYNALPALAATPWVDPVNPGARANIPPAAGTAQINRILTDYTTQMNQFIIQENTDKAALQLLMDAIEPTYYQVLEDPDEGYADIRLRDLVQHLNTTYGEVTPDDLTANEANLDKQWTPSQPLEDLWKQCTDCQAFAADHDPITNNRLIRAATDNLEKSGVFDNALRKWRERPRADHTWPNLITHMTAANKERLRKKTTGEFAATVKKTPTTIDPHSTESLLAALLAVNQNHPLLNKENMPPPMYYCWSHGLGYNPEHTGYTCTETEPGHKKEATQYNMMGGCNRIHRLEGEVPVWKYKYKPRKQNKNKNKDNKGNDNKTSPSQE